MQQNHENVCVLIIDDEKKLNNLLSRIISLEGFKVKQAYNGREGLRILSQEDVHVVLSDVKLPDANGVELVEQIKKRKPYVEVINLTAYGNIPDGVQSIKNGAFDYITKGDDNDKIIPLLCKASEKALLQKRAFDLDRVNADKPNFDAIIGNSPQIKESIQLARKVAQTDTTVLLLGETGTGKEVFAQAIHFESNRKHQRFVALNCSGFNSELLESELFGYKAGAFTGAGKDKKGLFEEANGGTIFLDEIGEMNLDLQAKLLRVLETQTFIKLGDTSTTRVNVRIIAATNRNLQVESEEGKFRMDLYYRLSVFTISLPSLSGRLGDIELLAEFFLKEYGRKANRLNLQFDSAFLKILKEHTWKGNIRELKNVIERVVILAEKDIIDPSLLPFEFQNDLGVHTSLNMQMMEKQHIRKVLNYTHGNKTEAARLLGIGLTTLYRKLEEYKIQ
ncbi:DNA-binding NtrC family response regulator [Arcticibacter tournemirensis]|uniref:Sigma-54-dependent Fis family transcriptional regulator n=1 Tax=Arcticibacter tournemirensis TaxID=699437 RepID=A0A5M9HE76_9SPHI|nr:sigma-54 dependent transcriptional regulator [Arcticibacter tournemirensis]KAA8485296.1 sigma-54-dependent Fis family transcriptional regulator [Arcticibacter tournemirensis]TQM50420.1 DNA-binding NtrC family response regulator [Arcticibacter tournemirensis]